MDGNYSAICAAKEGLRGRPLLALLALGRQLMEPLGQSKPSQTRQLDEPDRGKQRIRFVGEHSASLNCPAGLACECALAAMTFE